MTAMATNEELARARDAHVHQPALFLQPLGCHRLGALGAALGVGGAAQGVLTQLGSSIEATTRDIVAPRTRQINANIQRELPFGTMLEVAYVGTRGRDQARVSLGRVEGDDPPYLDLALTDPEGKALKALPEPRKDDDAAKAAARASTLSNQNSDTAS